MSNASESKSWSRWAALFVLWTLLGLFFATKTYYLQFSAGATQGWLKALWWNLMEWYGWGALSPLILRICRSLDATVAARRWGRLLTAHLGSALALAVLHGAILTVGARIEAVFLESGLGWGD